MSRIEHHPAQDTLASYSAGALPAAMALVVGCHLQVCDVCRREVAALENLGGQLMEALPPRPLTDNARERMMAMLDEQPSPAEAALQAAVASKVAVAAMPTMLRNVLGSNDYDALPWKTVAPGIRQLIIETGEGNSRMLRIAAGKKMPVHSHRGNELTMILSGGYSDALGKFNAGDVADLDNAVEHQPIADADEDCICLAGMDAPLRFRGWMARLMQPFVGI